jgi:hypothetical protein
MKTLMPAGQIIMNVAGYNRIGEKGVEYDPEICRVDRGGIIIYADA